MREIAFFACKISTLKFFAYPNVGNCLPELVCYVIVNNGG